jgi:hypothetical protein
MKSLALLLILIINFFGYAQDIKSLNQQNSRLLDSLTTLDLELKKCSTSVKMNVLELSKSKSALIDQIQKIELRKIQIKDKIEKYNVSLANKSVYDNLKKYDIYLVSDKYDKKIKKLRKYLIKSEIISSSDSLLFTIDNFYKYSIDNNNRINYLQNLIIDDEIRKLLQISKEEKAFLVKLKSLDSFLELKTGVSEQYLSFNEKLKLVNDTIGFYTIELNITKHKIDSLLNLVDEFSSFVKNRSNEIYKKIELNKIQIQKLEKDAQIIAKNANKYSTIRIGAVDICLNTLCEKTFNDGKPIQEARTPGEWDRFLKNNIPAFKYQNYDVKNEKVIYYNEHVFNSSKEIAPLGYHVLNNFDLKSLDNKIIFNKKKKKESCYCDNGYSSVGIYCTNCDYWSENQRKYNYCSNCKNNRVVSYKKQICSNCGGKTYYYKDYFEEENLSAIYYRFNELGFEKSYNIEDFYVRDGKFSTDYYFKEHLDSYRVFICKNPLYKENGNYTYTKIGIYNFVDQFVKKSTFANGDRIKKIKDPKIDPVEWELAELKNEPVYYIPSEDSLLGYVYNSYVFSDKRGIAPTGLNTFLISEYLYTEKFTKIKNWKRLNHSFFEYGNLLLFVTENIDYSNLNNTTNGLDENIENNPNDKNDEKIKGVESFYYSEAEYPGGIDKLQDWIINNLEFPDDSDGGYLMVQLTISKSGKVLDIEFLDSSPEELVELKNQIKRVFKKMPTWKPAKNNDIPTEDKIVIPIKFKL